jgi:hypothetical protein
LAFAYGIFGIERPFVVTQSRSTLVKIILAFAIVVSLSSLSGLPSGSIRFPSIPSAWAIAAPCPTHGSSDACSEYWYPAGPAMDLEQVNIFPGAAAESNCSGPAPLVCASGLSTDLTDSPISQMGVLNDSAVYITAPVGGLGASGQFAYLSNWQRVINDENIGIPNFFTWLDAYSPNPLIPGTVRQAFATSTSSVNPYVASTPRDFYVVGNIYDSLSTVNPLSSNQLLDWTTASSSPLPMPNSQLTYFPPAGTVATYRFSLRTDLFFHDGRKVTSFDAAFSYLSLKANGAFQASGAASMTGVTVLSPSQFDINLNSTSAFTKSSLTALTIMPGRYWTNAGLSLWDLAANVCSLAQASCYPSQYTLGPTPPSGPPTVICSFQCTFPASNMNADPSKTNPSFDPLSSGILIGSGPWECLSSVDVPGIGCSSSGTGILPIGGSYSLTRFGRGLPPGTSVAGDYFRSSGSLALWIWSGDNGDLTHDFLNFSHAAFCYNNPASTCQPLTEGIGGCIQGCRVGLSQIAIVARFVGVNWVSPFSLASPPVGMGPFPPILYSGSQTLNPASVVGCASPYPIGGYDC